MSVIMALVNWDGVPSSFKTELLISTAALCSLFQINFRVSTLTLKSQPEHLFDFNLLNVFRRLSSVKLSV